MNIGGATGDGLADVEIDLPKGGGAWEQANAHRLPATWTFTSGTGGPHRLYRTPQGVRITTAANVLAPGVDVRGEGGQCVLPPSTHYSGAQYQWVEGCAPWDIPLADAPAWLVEAIREKQPKPRAAAPASGQRVPLEDQEIEIKARLSHKHSTKFRALHDRGETSGYKSASEADQALFCIYAFWAGKDRTQMERLGRRSALYRAQRWTDDYINRTIEYACDHVTTIYTGGTRRAGRTAAGVQNYTPAPAAKIAEEMLLDSGNISTPQIAEPTPLAARIEQAIKELTAGGATSLDLPALLAEAGAAIKQERELRQVAEAGRLLAEARAAELDDQLFNIEQTMSNSLIPGDKLAALGMQRVLAEQGIRNGTEITINVADIIPQAAARAGVSVDTIGRFITKQYQAKKLHRDVTHDSYITRRINRVTGREERIRDWGSDSNITLFSDFYKWSELTSPKGEKGESYGGARTCPKCGSEDTEVVAVKRHCKKCGTNYTTSKKPQIAEPKAATQQAPIETADCGVDKHTDAADCGMYTERINTGGIVGALPPRVNPVPPLVLDDSFFLPPIEAYDDAPADDYSPPLEDWDGLSPSLLASTMDAPPQGGSCPMCGGDHGPCGWPGACAYAYLYPPSPPLQRYQNGPSSVTAPASAGQRT